MRARSTSTSTGELGREVFLHVTLDITGENDDDDDGDDEDENEDAEEDAEEEEEEEEEELESKFLCSLIGTLNGVGLTRDPTDPAKFLQCFLSGSDLQTDYAVESKFCRFGTLWDDDIGTCVNPFAVGSDPCRSGTPGDERDYGIQCNAYWQCAGGGGGGVVGSNALCCPTGQAYVTGVGCVADASCTDQCPPTSAASFPVFCPYAVSPLGPEYYRVHTSSFIIDKACPTGLTFDFEFCFCNGTATDGF
ncbi:protein PIF-like [Aplysia californica]|uniref:Protein PIF-like n=1 Tax=Aplysia californica TaxID=6500 RepID=A0ABM1ADH1_APLCA|nr:protein PIF-like [Aplysia californica]